MSRPGLPICIVTGFLGAGKTTLLNHVLRNRDGLRAVVFVNEFGSVDVDGALVQWQGSISEDRVVTLDNGCICCEVNDDLAGQLHRVLNKHVGDLDFVLIETSGVCDPGPVLATLDVVEDLAFATHVDSVLAVVDARDFDEEIGVPNAASIVGLQDTAKAQLAHCDIAILNKCDLLGGLDSERSSKAAVALEEHLRSASSRSSRPPPKILRSERASLDLALITSLFMKNEDILPQIASNGASLSPTTPPPRPYPAATSSPLSATPKARSRSPSLRGNTESMRKRITPRKGLLKPSSIASMCGAFRSHASDSLRESVHSFVYEATRPFDPIKLEEWIDAGGPPKSIVRAKGLIWLRGIPRSVIFQLSGSRTNPFETIGGNQPSRSHIVFIGQASALHEGDKVTVIEALDACLF